jgi:hypothetical protein
MSRNPLYQSDLYQHEDIAEKYVHLVSRTCIPKAIPRKELVRETNADSVLVEVKKMIRGMKYEKSESIKSFEKLVLEFSVTSDGLVMRGNQVVIPKSLQNKILTIAHSGHQGIVKTRKLLREFVWFSGMAKKWSEWSKIATSATATSIASVWSH